MKPSIRSVLSATLLSAALITLTAGVAQADVSFCTDNGNCVKAHLENVSSATVKSTKITQEKGANDCEGGIEKTISQNLTGGTKLTPGEKVTFYVDKRCKYKVKFKTTSGCTGDKTTHISSGDLGAGTNVARIEGACGTLKTKTTHPDASFE
ncbi:MAG: hypothetical protein AAFO63_04550 [Pseudomonadota bacterium]